MSFQITVHYIGGGQKEKTTRQSAYRSGPKEQKVSQAMSLVVAEGHFWLDMVYAASFLSSGGRAVEGHRHVDDGIALSS
jgi:hypothetical protein